MNVRKRERKSEVGGKGLRVGGGEKEARKRKSDREKE